jgi:hypothetical protein
VSDADAGVRQAAIRNLIAAGCFGAYGLTLSAVHAVSGFGVTCLWRELTGTLCPFCGATRMGSDLLVGDVSGAWSANPFVLTALGILGLAAASWAVTALGGPRLRLPGRLADGRTWFWLTVVTAAVFMVVRNLLPH